MNSSQLNAFLVAQYHAAQAAVARGPPPRAFPATTSSTVTISNRTAHQGRGVPEHPSSRAATGAASAHTSVANTSQATHGVRQTHPTYALAATSAVASASSAASAASALRSSATDRPASTTHDWILVKRRRPRSAPMSSTPASQDSGSFPRHPGTSGTPARHRVTPAPLDALHHKTPATPGITRLRSWITPASASQQKRSMGDGGVVARKAARADPPLVDLVVGDGDSSIRPLASPPHSPSPAPKAARAPGSTRAPTTDKASPLSQRRPTQPSTPARSTHNTAPARPTSPTSATTNTKDKTRRGETGLLNEGNDCGINTIVQALVHLDPRFRAPFAGTHSPNTSISSLTAIAKELWSASSSKAISIRSHLASLFGNTGAAQLVDLDPTTQAQRDVPCLLAPLLDVLWGDQQKVRVRHQYSGICGTHGLRVGEPKEEATSLLICPLSVVGSIEELLTVKFAPEALEPSVRCSLCEEVAEAAVGALLPPGPIRDEAQKAARRGTTPLQSPSRRSSLAGLGDLVFIQFARFGMGSGSTKKVTRKVELTPVLSSTFIRQIASQSSDLAQTEDCYKLVGVIAHHGDRVSNGHYTVRLSSQGKLLHLNDEQVSLVDTLDDGDAYLVIYQRVSPLAQTHSNLVLPQARPVLCLPRLEHVRWEDTLLCKLSRQAGELVDSLRSPDYGLVVALRRALRKKQTRRFTCKACGTHLLTPGAVLDHTRGYLIPTTTQCGLCAVRKPKEKYRKHILRHKSPKGPGVWRKFCDTNFAETKRLLYQLFEVKVASTSMIRGRANNPALEEATDAAPAPSPPEQRRAARLKPTTTLAPPASPCPTSPGEVSKPVSTAASPGPVAEPASTAARVDPSLPPAVTRGQRRAARRKTIKKMVCATTSPCLSSPGALARQVAKPSTISARASSSTTANAPRRALSAYSAWFTATRYSIARALGMTDVTREAGRLWRGMTPKDKKKWEDAAALDKVRYQKECAAEDKTQKSPLN